MSDMQDAILAAITSDLPAGLVGRVYVQRGFTTILDIAYDFAPVCATIQVSGVNPATDLPAHLADGLRERARRPSGGQDGHPWVGWWFNYTQGDVIDRMLGAIAHLIRTRAATRRP